MQLKEQRLAVFKTTKRCYLLISLVFILKHYAYLLISLSHFLVYKLYIVQNILYNCKC